MPDGLSQRLFSILQLTRMTLVFTALSNILAGHLLQNPSSWSLISMLLLALVSVCLYGLGVALNDIIDRRKDAALAAWRPLPSGAIRLRAAHILCLCLALFALFFGALFARKTHPTGVESMFLILAVLFLILFYNLVSKWIAGLGILTLALIRMLHALIGAPEIPVLLHPLTLFIHILIITLISYRWEEKRPLLTPSHYVLIPAGALLIPLTLILLTNPKFNLSIAHLWILGLMLVFLAAIPLFKLNAPSPRLAGQRLALAGALWLIPCDAVFLWIHNGPAYGWTILALLPLSAIALMLMNAWNKILWLTQPVNYKREPSGPMPPSA